MITKQTRDAATTINAVGLAGIALPSSPRLVGIAGPKGSGNWQVEELSDNVAIRDWLRAPDLGDGVVVDTRTPGVLTFVHLDVLARVPYEVCKGRVWVELDDVVLDGRAMHDPELLFGLADALERMGARLTRHDEPTTATALFPPDSSWS